MKASESQGSRGFSLPELLVALAIAGLLIAIAVPLVADTMRSAKVRSAADQMANDLRAARMIAVSKRVNVPFTVNTDPTNTYSYTDAHGVVRTVNMPLGVSIASATPATVTFQANGALSSAASTVVQVALGSGVTERWTVSTNTLGVSSLTWVRN